MKKESFIVVDPDGNKYRVYWHTHRRCWYAQWKANGVWERRSLDAASKPDAEQAARKLWGPRVPKANSVSVVQRLTWNEFAAKYLAYKVQQGKAPRSIARFKATMEAFERYLAKEKIQSVDNITLPVLEGYVRYRMKDEACKAKTAYTDALTLKNAFKWVPNQRAG